VSEQQLPLGIGTEAAEEFSDALVQVLSGGFRLADWGQAVGIPSVLGLTAEEWAERKLKGPVRLSRAERRAAVKYLTDPPEAMGRDLSLPEAAKALGVSESTIDRDRRKLREAASGDALDPPSSSGTAPLAASPDAADEAWLVEPCADCGKPTRRRWLHDEDEFGGRLLCDDCAEALDQATVAPPHVHVGENSGENEWYTPAAYVEAARAVMGDIDLDPASNAVANGTVGASIYYDADRNGLAHEWFGRVWMNPPYAQPACAHFCQKLVAHFEQDTVTEACVLVNNATETEWFQAVAQRAVAVCFPNGRIRFWHPDRQEGAPLQGQAVLYLGPHPTEFRHQFGRFGIVLERADA
jgi:hypothetical protein